MRSERRVANAVSTTPAAAKAASVSKSRRSSAALFTDMAGRKVIPKPLLAALPAPAAYAQVKFANAKQNTDGRAKIASEWPAKVGA